MCVSPIAIKVNNIEGVHFIQVPCGKCFECLKTRQNDYMVRIREEMMRVPYSCFVTLTYNNSSVPFIEVDGKRLLCVSKEDVKNWIKRFRTNYERKTGKKGLRYFLCSEYGPRTQRPHYHAIFFGLNSKDIELALNDWRSRFGFVLAKDVNGSLKDIECSARYISKYASKGVFENPFRFTVQPSEKFSSFFKRIRKELHIPYGCFPSFFVMSQKEYLQFGLSPEREIEFHKLLFGRGISSEICFSW